MSYTKQECLDALELVNCEVDGMLTGKEYNNHRKDEHPCRATIAKQFDSWNDAKQSLNMETREGYSPKGLSKEDCIKHLIEVSSNLDHEMSNSDYQEHKEADHADESTIRYYLGTWNEAKEKAELDTLEEREFTTDYSPGKLSVDTEYFNDLNAESAYWIGFLFADGHVNADRGRFELGLSKKDESHLRTFRKCIKAEHPISEKDTNHETKAVRIAVSQAEFIESLTQWGLDIGKTFSDEIPDISATLMPHFVRGLYDGDGHLSNTTIEIAGYIPRFKNLFSILPVEGHIYTKYDQIGYVSFSGSDAERLSSWMYPDGKETEPKLDRKYPERLC